MDTTTTNQQASHATDASTSADDSLRPRPQPLYRPVGDRMLAGVASGFARYLGVDVTAVRVVLAVLVVFGGAGVPLYLAGWLLIPEEGCEQSVASSFIQSRQAARHDR